MTCCSSEWNEKVSAWFDAEVGAGERRRVEAHLAACAECTRAAAEFDAVRRGLRGARAAAAHPPAPRRRRTALAAAAVVAAAVTLAGVRAQWPSEFERTLARDVERQHLRSFSRAEPCEYESSDPAAVAGWVERTLGYRAQVPELRGATLLGARRCTLEGEPAAHLLYRVGDRALTVFVPRGGTRADRAARGFARDGARCTQAPLGDRVCVVPGDGEPRLAVSEAEPHEVLALFGS